MQGRVRELEARLRQDSSNSSKPPSSDPPWKPPSKRKGKGKRKRGGQAGHKGHKRDLVDPDEVVALAPEQCGGCGTKLAGTATSPQRHQVVELPELAARVTEYQLHALKCAGCGTTTRAALPHGVPSGSFGPRLQAVASVCTGAYRLSKRATETLLRDFFGVRISLGSVSNIEKLTSESLAQSHDEVLSAVRKAPVVHADETGWTEGTRRAWLWTASTNRFAAFVIRPSRGAEAAQELLGRTFPGVLVSDQYNGYNWLSDRRRQLCWAHLIRRFRGLVELGGKAKAHGQALLDLTERVFAVWHRIRDGTSRRRDLPMLMRPIEQNFNALLLAGAESSTRRVRSLCKGLLRRESCMWTFVRRRGVAPTNNLAERALRPAVIWRKSSFGTDSPRGSRFAERMLTVVGTLRLQGRNVLEFLAEACRSRLQRRPMPSLLAPTP